MPQNVEIKAKISTSFDEICKVSKELSGSEGVILNQEDTFFNATNGRLKLRKISNGNDELLYYSRIDSSGPKLSDYKKVTIEKKTTQDLKETLALSLGTMGEVVKTRTLFLVGQTRVHVDQVEELGQFVELEVVLRDDQSLSEGEAIAVDLMAKLGIRDEDLIHNAYVDMLNEKKI